MSRTNQYLVESVAIMIAVKMKLNFEAMQILMGKLQQNQMWAIYLMASGKEMTDNVAKVCSQGMQISTFRNWPVCF